MADEPIRIRMSVRDAIELGFCIGIGLSLCWGISAIVFFLVFEMASMR